MNFLLLGVGFVLLLGAAEILVRGAVAVSSRIGISRLLIGMTVVAFGTSSPELVVSVNAAISGAPEMALGNIIGSNIANVLLIIGGVGLLSPVVMQPHALRRDTWFLLGSTLLFVAVCVMGVVDWHAGVVFLSLLAGFIIYAYRQERAEGNATAAVHLHEVEEFEDITVGPIVAWVFLLAGIAGVVYGAELLVGAAVSIARDFGVGEEIIGLTLVAFGTSLPEFVTSLVAAWRRHADVAMGNLLGSNLFNLLAVGGAASVMTPIAVPEQILKFDLWAMLVATLAIVYFLLMARPVRKREAAIFMISYIAYLALQGYGVANALPWLGIGGAT